MISCTFNNFHRRLTLWKITEVWACIQWSGLRPASGKWVFVPEPGGGWKILGSAGGWARANAGIVKAYWDGRVCGTLVAAWRGWKQDGARGRTEGSKDKGRYWRAALGVMNEQLIRSGSEWAESDDDDDREEEQKKQRKLVNEYSY